MNFKKYIYGLLLLGGAAGMLSSCGEKENLDDDCTLSEESTADIKDLKTILCEAPNGWHITYFPKVNQNLNTDISENYKNQQDFKVMKVIMKRMGVGGYNMFVKFNPDGSAKMISDIAYKETDKESSYKPVFQTKLENTNYDIKVGDGLILYFTTNTMIDQLKLMNFNAETHFSPVKISNDSIIMRTLNYKKDDNESELIVFKKLNVPTEQWEENMAKFVAQKESFRNRGFKDNTLSKADDKICVLQIKLKNPNQLIYETNVDINKSLITDRLSYSYSRDADKDALVARFDRMQYEIFLRNEQPERTISDVDQSEYYTGLGSGYAATDKGLYFYPGFKYEDGIVFNEFVHTPGKKEWKSECKNYEAIIHFVNPEQK